MSCLLLLILMIFQSTPALAKNFGISFKNGIEGFSIKGISISRKKNEVHVSGKYRKDHFILLNGKKIKTDSEGNFKNTLKYKISPFTLTFKTEKKKTATLLVTLKNLESNNWIVGLDVSRFLYKDNNGEKTSRTLYGPTIQYQHHFGNYWRWNTRVNAPLAGSSQSPDVKLLLVDTVVEKKTAGLLHGCRTFLQPNDCVTKRVWSF